MMKVHDISYIIVIGGLGETGIQTTIIQTLGTENTTLLTELATLVV